MYDKGNITNDTFLVAQMVKHLPTMQETQVRSLGWEDPLEKEMASHSSTLAWKIPWTEERGRLQSMGSQRVGHDWATSLHFTNDNGELDYLAKCIEKIGCSFKKNKAKYNILMNINNAEYYRNIIVGFYINMLYLYHIF